MSQSSRDDKNCELTQEDVLTRRTWYMAKLGNSPLAPKEQRDYWISEVGICNLALSTFSIARDKNYRRTFDRINELEDKASKDGDWESAFVAMCQHANTLNGELMSFQSSTAATKAADDPELNKLLYGEDANMWLGRLYDAAKAWKERALKAETVAPSATASASEIERLKAIEHAAWDAMEACEEQDDCLIVPIEEGKELSALLPESHP